MATKQGRQAGVNLTGELEKILGVEGAEQQLAVVNQLARVVSTPVLGILVLMDPRVGRPTITPVGGNLPLNMISNILSAAQQELLQAVTEAAQKKGEPESPPQDPPTT